MMSDVLKTLAPHTADQLEDMILTLACREINEEREMLMDALSLAYSKAVPYQRFRDTMILVNECLEN
jgi:hypothetical protein